MSDLSGAYTPFAESGLRSRGPVQLANFPAWYNNPVDAWRLNAPGGPANACGQSTMASLLAYWGTLAAPSPWYQHVEKVYKSSDGCPDFGFGYLGTTIERIRDYLGTHKLHTRAYNDSRAAAGASDDKYDWLRGYVDNGYPVAVILDVGRMYGGIGAHWCVVVGFQKGHVLVANFQTQAGQVSPGVRTIPVQKFMDGWECMILGNISHIIRIHYPAVIAYT